ncbi:hypothetical protein LTR70_000823 [Exophiala xenobiotica]|uniref:Uncharacterized protein n=1 Tax=Lithohypha guttulata TaxID=1690604 RepID=A0ABR0KND0_9EURO|nr:hypothetical protein LTR24_000504 [Lithohypha guttulata]KAK5329326.1 hypothetical protein LTR70_000823 [Exophiala xenobiotica]
MPPTRPRDSSPERKREKKESRGDKPVRPENKERERDHDMSKDKDKERKHRSSHPHPHRSTSTKEKSASKTSLSSTDSRRRTSMPGIAEQDSSIDNADSKSKSSAYPAFSKEHSKEAVAPRADYGLFTPPSTDVNASKEKLANLNRIINNGPPSPPLTDKNAGRPKPNTKSATVDTIVEEQNKEESDSRSARRSKTRASKPTTPVRKSSGDSSSVSRVKSKKETTSTPLRTSTNRPDHVTVASQATRSASPPRDDSNSDEANTTLSSDGTSIAPEQPAIQRPGSKVLQPVVIEDWFPHYRSVPGATPSRHETPVDVIIEPGSAFNTPSSMGGPPPPPPPPHVPLAVPRVDYLLQNGGLNHPVPKNLLYAGKPMAVQQATMSPRHPIVVTNLFEPYNQLLSDFEKVMAKNGSLAVATGYSMCELDNDREEDIQGVSWGEILELVSGRKDLPSWPPFTLADSARGLGLSFSGLQTPMQKLDIDVPEEYREHYIRQSQKTKQSVDRWLNRQQGSDPSSAPPEDVDDETLTFAILTHIPAEHRPIFKDLLGIIDLPMQPPRRAPSPDRDQQHPPRTAPTPIPHKNRPDYIIAAGLAIQRLYRLHSPPRDPETAIFLLNNPSLHHPLATLAAVSSDEWDILTSGRFDGFLRSGAEDDFPTSSHNQNGYPPPTNGRYTPQHVGRAPSRGATPAYGPTRSRQNSGAFNQSRPQTAPGFRSVGGPTDSGKTSGPIALDEETEIATLAEIERDIYVGMEALEDAFEQLHLRAESVRLAIRERNAGLAAAQQRRKQSDIEIRAGTPASNFGGEIGPGMYQWENETDDGIADDVSELAPDDSASNISSNRRRKHKRRNERRTPVVGPIDEEDESEGYITRESSPEKR